MATEPAQASCEDGRAPCGMIMATHGNGPTRAALAGDAAAGTNRAEREAAMSTLIRGGTVVTADERYPADVLCADGKIQEIGTAIDVPAGAAIVDAG